MPRRPRLEIPNQKYHVINRANARVKIFNTDEDYLLFLRILKLSQTRSQIKFFSFVIMPNHFHFLVESVGELSISKFMHHFTSTFTQKWHDVHGTKGTGHLFQGRYKSILIDSERYFFSLLRYIEQNPIRSGLVNKTEDWQWSSLNYKYLIERNPTGYTKSKNTVLNGKKLESIRYAISNNLPFGSEQWKKDLATKYGVAIEKRSGKKDNF